MKGIFSEGPGWSITRTTAPNCLITVYSSCRVTTRLPVRKTSASTTASTMISTRRPMPFVFRTGLVSVSFIICYWTPPFASAEAGTDEPSTAMYVSMGEPSGMIMTLTSGRMSPSAS